MIAKPQAERIMGFVVHPPNAPRRGRGREWLQLYGVDTFHVIVKYDSPNRIGVANVVPPILEEDGLSLAP